MDLRKRVRWTKARRQIAPLAGLSLVAVLVLAGCGGMPIVDQQPYSTISPATAKAESIQGLYRIIFWAALVVFVLVQFAIVYAALKFRRRDDVRPVQLHGSRVLEILWTAIPAVLLLLVFIPTAKVLYENAAAVETADFEIDVYGKQWWWEIHYPDIPLNESDTAMGPLVTANEVIVPQGASVVFNLYSNNVIHSFWVPQLSGKTDVVPGHNNKLQFTADRVGEYWGECAEFCGGAHSWMRFKVIVVPPDEFAQWVNDFRTPPGSDGDPSTADVAETPKSFGVCLGCHQIAGTNAKYAPTGMSAIGYGVGTGNGPNLTMLACRDTIAAGILENTPDNIRLWLMETDQVKEGVYMPNFYKSGSLTVDQVNELVDYLSSLKPAGGCPQDGPTGGDPAFVSEQASDADVPAATPAP